MKQIITFLIIAMCAGNIKSQTLLADFENFSLPGNSYYKDTNNNPFVTANASFVHEWTMGSYPYWSAGFAYTNVYDSATAGFNNLYGVKAYKGVNGSAKFVVAQDKGTIRLTNAGTYLQGFYYTNTTYAYKAMRDGDMFCRKFGDTTGTGTTTLSQGAYPDYFKVVVRGYKNGALKTDSVEFYLADYRSSTASQDYIASDWRYVNTASLGIIDSVRFFMRSTDMGVFGMNTPAFFAIDDLSTTTNPLALKNESDEAKWRVYPNPLTTSLNLYNLNPGSELSLYDLTGKLLLHTSNVSSLDLSSLDSGVYWLQVRDRDQITGKKIIKH